MAIIIALFNVSGVHFLGWACGPFDRPEHTTTTTTTAIRHHLISGATPALSPTWSGAHTNRTDQSRKRPRTEKLLRSTENRGRRTKSRGHETTQLVAALCLELSVARSPGSSPQPARCSSACFPTQSGPLLGGLHPAAQIAADRRQIAASVEWPSIHLMRLIRCRDWQCASRAAANKPRHDKRRVKVGLEEGGDGAAPFFLLATFFRVFPLR
jgi:hypothetical protein